MSKTIVRLGQVGEVKIWHLLVLVAVLALGVLLATTNPSTEMYLAFVERELGKALDSSESSERSRERNMVRTIFRAHSHELVVSVVAPHTIRHNYGLFSLYKTTALDTDIEVLGIGTHFFPIKGVEEAVLRLGRLAF